MINPIALAITCGSLEAGCGTIIPAAPTLLESALILHNEEADRLASSQLFAVNAAMTAKAQASGALLPDWSVQPTDLPCKQGLLVFDEPIGMSETAGGAPAPIVACSWGHSTHCSPPSGAVWVTFWSAPDHGQLVRKTLGRSQAEARMFIERELPPLVWDDEALLCWSARAVTTAPSTVNRFIPSADVTGVIAHQRTLSWIQTTLATWLLIQQPAHAEVTEQHAPRHERRRAAREGRTLPPVRVVSIHRRTGPSRKPATSSGRTVGVRFEVPEFWRYQVHGKGRALRKRILVEKHWRGPEDAPVLLRPRVTLVDEPPDQAT